jgi:hypothetical protein
MNQYGLTKLTVIGCFAVAVFSVGFLGIGGFGGTPLVIPSKKGSTAIVFAAAPFNTTRIVPENLQLVKANAPPEYDNVTFSKKHPVQFKPSSSCGTFLSTNPVCDVVIGGTTGTPPSEMAVWASTGCSRIDAWFPESMKNALQAPTINDPNASVTLDITPPSGDSRGDCAVWVYHYGNPPDKPQENLMVASE